MPDRPADPPLPEAVIFLTVKGIEIWVDRIDGIWVYAELEAELIARAVMLGMMGHGTVQ